MGQCRCCGAARTRTSFRSGRMAARSELPLADGWVLSSLPKVMPPPILGTNLYSMTSLWEGEPGLTLLPQVRTSLKGHPSSRTFHGVS